MKTYIIWYGMVEEVIVSPTVKTWINKKPNKQNITPKNTKPKITIEKSWNSQSKIIQDNRVDMRQIPVTRQVFVAMCFDKLWCLNSAIWLYIYYCQRLFLSDKNIGCKNYSESMTINSFWYKNIREFHLIYTVLNSITLTFPLRVWML